MRGFSRRLVAAGLTSLLAVSGLSPAGALAAGAATHLAFLVQPSTTVAGALIADVTVEVLDADGSVVDTDGSAITLSISANPGGGTLSGTSTVAATSGVATFTGLTIDRAGAGYTLVASNGQVADATSDAFDILPGPASPAMSTITATPASVVADGVSASTITVRLRDALGNDLTASGGTVTLAASGPGSLGDVTDHADGTYSATFTSGISVGTTTITGALDGADLADAATIALTPGAATHFVVTAASPQVAGTAFSFTVTARDANDNIATGYAGTVAFASTDPGVITLPDPHAFDTADNGSHAFTSGATLVTAGTWTITATETPTGSIAGTSGPLDVGPGSPAKLAFTTQPGSAAATAPLDPQPVVEIRDTHGNRTNATSGVTLTISHNPGGGTLTGTTTVAAVAGRATFTDLAISRAAAGYVLHASDGSLADADSLAFGITGGLGQAIAFGALPGRTYGDATFGLSATASSGLAVAFGSTTPTVCAVSGDVVTIVASGTCTIQADQPGDSTYAAATPVVRTFAVARRGITVTAVADSRPYDGSTTSSAIPTVTAGALAPGDSGSFRQAFDSPAVGAGKTLTPTGTVRRGLADVTADYAIMFVPVTTGVITGGLAQAVAFDLASLPAKTYGDPAFDIGRYALASSGLPVAFDSATPDACLVTGSAVTAVGAGTCTIAATQTGNAVYGSAAPVSRSFSIAKALPAVGLVGAPAGGAGIFEAGVPVVYAATLRAVRGGATPTGTVTFRLTGLADGTATLTAGVATHEAIFATVGTKLVTVEFVGDRNYLPGTASMSPTVIANSVAASAVGVSATSIYPYRDGWRDTVGVRGTRLEPASVSVAVFSPTGRKVRNTAFGRAAGTYVFAWNGRASGGTALPAGRYRVVQVLVDAFGARRTVTSYVALSTKRMAWYTKTLSVSRGPRNWQFGSSRVASELSPASSTSTAPLLMAGTGGVAWRAAGYEFSLPAATTYRSLSFQVRGSWTGATAPKIGLLPWSGGSWSAAVYDYARARTPMGPGASVYHAQTVTSPSGIVAGRKVRAAIDSFAAPAGYGPGPFRYSITSARLVVRYGILK